MVDINDPIECCRARLREIAQERGIGRRQAIDVLCNTVEGWGVYTAAQQRYATTTGATPSGRRSVNGFVDALCEAVP